jgi:hypothetical protein
MKDDDDPVVLPMKGSSPEVVWIAGVAIALFLAFVVGALVIQRERQRRQQALEDAAAIDRDLPPIGPVLEGEPGCEYPRDGEMIEAFLARCSPPEDDEEPDTALDDGPHGWYRTLRADREPHEWLCFGYFDHERGASAHCAPLTTVTETAAQVTAFDGEIWRLGGYETTTYSSPQIAELPEPPWIETYRAAARAAPATGE